MEDYEDVRFYAWTEDEITSEYELDVDHVRLRDLISNAQAELCDEIIGWKIECGSQE